MNYKNILGFIIAFIITIFAFQSCTKDDMSKSLTNIYDNRDSVVGTFTGTLITTTSGIPESVSKTVTVTKGENGKLLIEVGSNVSFNTDMPLGTKSNLAGSIPQQNVTYNGSSASLIGAGVSNQHYVFTSNNNTLRFGASITQDTTTKTIAFTGTK